jgi:hypothetical protein
LSRISFFVLALLFCSAAARAGEPEHGSTQNTVSSGSRVAVGACGEVLNPDWKYLDVDTHLAPGDVGRGVKLTWSDVYSREPNTRWTKNETGSGGARQLWQAVLPAGAAGRRVFVEIAGGLSVPGDGGPGKGGKGGGGGGRSPNWFSLAVDVDIDVDSDHDGRIEDDNASALAVAEDAGEDSDPNSPGALVPAEGYTEMKLRGLMRGAGDAALAGLIEGQLTILAPGGDTGRVALSARNGDIIEAACDSAGRVIPRVWGALLAGRDVTIEVRGFVPGTVRLEATLKVRPAHSTGAYTAYRDAVRMTVLGDEDTKWLVTHDPDFERRSALKHPERCSQTRLMGNLASFSVPAGTAGRVALFWRGRQICEAFRAGSLNGSDVCLFRTSLQPDGTDLGHAFTDAEGGVYVEGVRLPAGPGTYQVRIFAPDMAKYEARELVVGPLLTGLKFSPNLLAEKPATFDPYYNEYGVTGAFGMTARYVLAAGVDGGIPLPSGNGAGTIFCLEKRTGAPDERPGDIATRHCLVLAPEHVAKSTHSVKWEGFTDFLDFRDPAGESGSIKKAGVYMGPGAAFYDEVWGPPVLPGSSQRQTKRYLSSWGTAAEGAYAFRAKCRLQTDPSQVQQLLVGFAVRYTGERP